MSITKILAAVFGTANARKLRTYEPIVKQINAFEPAISALSDEQLTGKTIEFREQLAKGRTLDDILPEAYAVVRETAKRKLGQRHFDVQLIGGIALHEGKIAEMKTGEGKTLTATLPLYLNALSGKGSYLVTVNDYLARRDAEWMGNIFTHLGLTVGILQNQMSDRQRKEAYNSDILYATNSELGFDYLRDNMKFRLEDYVQRELNFAIVDEVDSILIDEARTPLIISGSTHQSGKQYEDVDRVVRRLKKDEDYEVDEKQRTCQMTEIGIDKIEAAFNVPNLYDVGSINLLHHVTQALRAHVLFKRDVDYIVRDEQVLIVDEFTGRILPGRRYSDGLHQALEAKEGVKVERETQTLAAITLQNFFRMFKKLAGMTGTASTEAEEFWNIYKLDVVSIPTNAQLIRMDKSDLIFLANRGKYKAIVEDIKQRHEKGQPVLIGTISVENSELLSGFLQGFGIPHEVLNAKNHAREAEIVALAGEPGRVTIATNMAGRGTDIKLTAQSREAGGLYILGTERHESRRIDNQLRGRSGRQGDPGESRFYISLEDDLIRRFAGDSIKKNMARVGMTEDEVIESKLVSNIIENAQEKVEKHNFEIRKHTLEYDDVLNQQRLVVYQYRREVLEGAERSFELVRDLIITGVQDLFGRLVPTRNVSPEEFEQLLVAVSALTGLNKEVFTNEKFNHATSETLQTDLIQFILLRYELYRNQAPAEAVQEAERWMLLETIDQAWKQHMLNLDSLREGIGLRGYGQKNPLIEYKREAFDMFQEMMQQVRLDAVHHLFHLDFGRFDEKELEQRREHELEHVHTNTVDESEVRSEAKATDVAGRNDPCPCGSGKKYKKCHGQA
jgi:preprotein translocase subunit SecA